MLKQTIKANVTYQQLTESSHDFVNQYLNPNHSDDSLPVGIPDTASSPFVFNKKTTSYILNIRDFQTLIGKTWNYSGTPEEVTITSISIHSINCIAYPILLQTTFVVKSDGNTYSAGYAVPDSNYQGDYLNKNLIARYRYIGKAVTIHNTTPKMYVSGSTTSCQYTYDIQETSSNIIYVGPRNDSEISTIKPYCQLDASEGAYCVNYNPSPLFYYHDVFRGADHISISRIRQIDSTKDDGRIYDITKALKYGDNISLSIVQPVEGFTDTATSIPVDATYGSWTIKQTQILDFVVRFNSPLVPYVIPAPIHDHQILELVQSFIAEYNNLYPANWNSLGDVWNKIKNFISEGKWIQPALSVANTLLPQLKPLTTVVGNLIKPNASNKSKEVVPVVPAKARPKIKTKLIKN